LKWSEGTIFSSKGFNINEDLAYKYIIICTNNTELKNTVQENMCIKLDVNGRLKLITYRGHWEGRSKIIVIRWGIVQ
jgi:outer membrane receptor for monomeric catechols